MKTILLIDGNTLQWRACYAFGESKVANGIVSYLCKIIDKTQPEKILIFWDISKSRWRGSLYPDYKAKRADSKKDIDIDQVYSQVKLAKRLINLLGIRQIEVNGVEADDLISWFSEYFYSVLRNFRIVVVTVDKDLWQLVNDRVIVLDFKTGDFVNESYVQHELGITKNLIPDLKSLSGDVSDNIPGVKGIGEKTALALLEKHSSLSGMLSDSALAELGKKKSSSKILDEFEEVLVYYRLTKAPSLMDMNLLMNSDEKRDLHKLLVNSVTKDASGIHMLRDFLDSGIRFPSGDYQVTPNDLSGFIPYLNSVETERTANLNDLDNRVRGCRRCSLREFCGDYGPVVAAGGVGAEIMLLGGHATLDDLKTGVPFSGESGVILEKFFEITGITMEECWITNLCKCYSSRAVTQGEILSCMSNFREELEMVSPKFIVAFGNEAMSAVLPHGSNLTKYVGEIFRDSVGLVGKVEARVAILPHPTYVVRSKRLRAEFEYGCEKIKEFLDSLGG